MLRFPGTAALCMVRHRQNSNSPCSPTAPTALAAKLFAYFSAAPVATVAVSKSWTILVADVIASRQDGRRTRPKTVVEAAHGSSFPFLPCFFILVVVVAVVVFSQTLLGERSAVAAAALRLATAAAAAEQARGQRRRLSRPRDPSRHGWTRCPLASSSPSSWAALWCRSVSTTSSRPVPGGSVCQVS